jgi:hypothetical protein
MSGNIIPNAVPVTKLNYQATLHELSIILPVGLSTFPFGSAGKKEISGDIDMLIDADELMKIFPETDIKHSRKLLQDYFISRGLFSVRSGVSVHVGIPIGNDIVQVDLMSVENAKDIQKLHDHDYDNPTMSGKTVVSMWCDMANLTSSGLMISPYKGLLIRQTRDFLSCDKDVIAKIILNPTATGEDMRSPKNILRAVAGNPIKTEYLINKYF